MSDLAEVLDACRRCLLDGRAADARRLALQGLERYPDSTRLRHLLATACLTLGDWAAAEDALRRVLAEDGANATAWDHLGVALHHQRRHDDAADAFARSLSLAVGAATTWANAASNAFDGGRYGEALRCSERALALDDGLAPAWLARGNALLALGRAAEALDCLERAVALPGAGAAERSSLAMAREACGQGEQAVRALATLVQEHPEQADARLNLAAVLYREGRVREALEHYRIALAQDPANAAAWSAWLFALTHSDECAPREVFEQHVRFGRRFACPRAHAKRHDHLSRDPERPLRVGFVSGDLREHPVARFAAPVWATLQRAGLLIHAYHSAPIEDAVSVALRRHTHAWRNVHALDDDALAARIEADAIDILFDLSGHTAYNRLPVFARRPAPVQISWMGYPGTTGLAAIDYRLVNANALPPGCGDDLFVERPVRLHTANRFEPPQPLPEITELPARSRGVLTFGSFARAGKITPASVALWSAVLARLPDARMIVGNVGEGTLRERLAAMFAGHGIARERLSFVPRLPLAEYLALHGEIDVLLDSAPYSGGTSVSFGLWMGVPTIAFAPADAPLTQRHGAGMLAEAGCDDWIANSREAFVERAVRARAELPALAALRAGLREHMCAMRERQSIDEELPALLRRMWRAWCAGRALEGEAGWP